VSSLSERVEAEVARAKRTFRQSRSIIAVARNELDSYGRWLDRHRVTWAEDGAEDAKRHHRLFNRTQRGLDREPIEARAEQRFWDGSGVTADVSACGT
jgi:hypothetical protein